MDEIRKNHIVRIKLSDNTIVEGKVDDYVKDRIMILVSPYFIEEAKKIKELDVLTVLAHTHLGIKKMISNVISELNKDNCIVIENNPAEPVEQKREFVRVLSDLNFTIEKENISYVCFCINISAGGIAFFSTDAKFNINDKVKIKFPKNEFEKDIETEAVIIKSHYGEFVAKYINLSSFDEDKIVKYVFRMIAKN